MLLSLTELVRLNLYGVRPELLVKLVQFEYRADTELGLTVYVPEFGGFRGAGVQAQLVREKKKSGGDYAVATPGTSFHECGAAFDVHIADGAKDTDDNYRKLAALGKELGLRAGYFFPKSDPYHFELDEPLAVAKATFAGMIAGRKVLAASLVLVAGLAFFFPVIA